MTEKTEFRARLAELNAYIRFHGASDAGWARIEREELLDSKAEAILALVEAAEEADHCHPAIALPEHCALCAALEALNRG